MHPRPAEPPRTFDLEDLATRLTELARLNPRVPLRLHVRPVNRRVVRHQYSANSHTGDRVAKVFCYRWVSV